MVHPNMVLALVVAKIFFQWVVFDVKLSRFNCIRDPEKSHFH
jgi:hypothetical protein